MSLRCFTTFVVVMSFVRYGLVAGGWGSAGAGQGLHELVNGSWLYWNWCGSNNSRDAGCFEGERPDSMTQDYNTYTFGFGVDWKSSEERVITDGHVLPLPPSTSQGKRHPLVFFTTARGGLRAAWDPVNVRYSFKHMNNDLVSMYSLPAPLWRSTGLGDTCVWETAWVKHAASGHDAMLMAVADGGVARTLDGGATYQRASENWAGTSGLNSQGTAIAVDHADGCCYVAHSARGHAGTPTSVFQSCDGGDQWRLLGGFGGGSNASSPGLNGLSVSGRISHIAVDFSSPLHARRLLVGAGVLGRRHGGEIWSFNPARPQPQWSLLLNTSGAFEFSAQGPITSESTPSIALATSGSAVIAINLTTMQWSTTQLQECCANAALVASALVPATTELRLTTVPVLIGGHCRSHPYGPLLVSTKVELAFAMKSEKPAKCTAIYDFEAGSTPGVAAMTVSSLVVDPMSPSGQTIIAGLQVGDYYDGDVPRHLFLTTNAKEFRKLNLELPNAVVGATPDSKHERRFMVSIAQEVADVYFCLFLQHLCNLRHRHRRMEDASYA
eukprot:SAG31_NODE_62_length_28678_cov_21.548270_16_plen_554_part_00